MRKAIPLFLAVLCILSTFAGCGNRSRKTEKEFYDTVSDSKGLLDSVANTICSYWYNSIHKNEFRGDIDYAIECAIEDSKTKIDTLKTNHEVIKEQYGKIKDGKLKSELKSVIQAYNAYYALVIDVTGSYKSFSEGVDQLSQELSSALKNLEFEI